jgi:DNA-binding NarL/FixJ family response regulator
MPLTTPDQHQRLDLLNDSVKVLEGCQAPIELAQALIGLGATHRRLGDPKAAKDRLSMALDVAHRSGAIALAVAAREELVAAGARPRRSAVTGVDALTASERRVAQLAAAGMGNRDIAQSLFVTQRTVETHLRNAYSKLAVHDRRDLAAILMG